VRRNPGTQYNGSARSQQHGNRGGLKHGRLTGYSTWYSQSGVCHRGGPVPLPCSAPADRPGLVILTGVLNGVHNGVRNGVLNVVLAGVLTGVLNGILNGISWGNHAAAARVRPVDRSGDERHVPPRLHATAARRAVRTPSRTPVSTPSSAP
jgi:hypothetical protein